MWNAMSRPGFELVSPCPFPARITITPRAPHTYIYFYIHNYVVYDIYIYIYIGQWRRMTWQPGHAVHYADRERKGKRYFAPLGNYLSPYPLHRYEQILMWENPKLPTGSFTTLNIIIYMLYWRMVWFDLVLLLYFDLRPEQNAIQGDAP